MSTSPVRRIKVAVAWLLAATAYLLAFGLAVGLDLATHLAGTKHEAQSTTEVSAALVIYVGLTALGLYTALGAIITLNRPDLLREWALGRRPSTPGGGLLSAGLPYAAGLLGAAVIYALERVHAVTPVNSPVQYTFRQGLGQAVMAGLGEELIVVALPIVILRATAPHLLTRTRPMLVVVAALTAVRMSYHLYQGMPTTQHLLWAVISVLVYIRFGRVWPMILAHIAWDLTVTIAALGWLSTPSTYLVLGVPYGALTVAGLVRYRRHRPPALEPAPLNDQVAV